MKQKIREEKFTDTLYSSILLNEMKNTGIHKIKNNTEPLAQVNYNDEIIIKDTVLQEYWKTNNLPGVPAHIIPSPKGRFYRTTTKRKVISSEGNYIFTLGMNRNSSNKEGVIKSVLEPQEHSVIYEILNNKISEPAYRLVGKSLNFIIIRGSYSEFTVIFNVHILNADIVRKLKSLGELLKRVDVNIVSAFIFLDPTRSDYYLENERPFDVVNFKKLFGPDKIFLKIDNQKYSYHPTSFSQINESAIPVLLTEAKRMLNPEKTYRFFDLYCGYGLFSLYMADSVSGCTGIDIEGESINSAILNASFHPSGNKIRFIPKNITGSSLDAVLPEPAKDELFLLDPPRQGTESGVIKAVAERNPARVLHIFCGIEQIKHETKEWNNHGYWVKEVQPVDMFPGTLNIEILILLEA